ncbi:MAG: PfkB family carbohydrate kinase [Candidatus Ratteibacteria bacterium]
MAEVVTIGETMIRLSTTNYQTIEQSDSLGFSVAGSESNVAISLSRLGISTMWISKLVNNFLGRKIVQEIKKYGVDTSKVIWTDTGKIGLYFIEYGSVPRTTRIIYDRKNSAINSLASEEINWNCLDDARLIHLSGITPALSKNCAKLVKTAIAEAKNRGKIISFDLNYRTKLWTPYQARKFYEEVLPDINVLIAARKDMSMVFGMNGEPGRLIRNIKEKFRNDVVALTVGSEGAFASDDKIYFRKAPVVQEIDRIGAGDAFAAGFIYGYLKMNIEAALSYGTALAALKCTIPGDIPYVTRDDIEDFIKGAYRDIER